MELRRVDPRTLKKNPDNPRKIQPGEMSDAALKASIKVVGIIQPPTVSEKDGALTIEYGERRVRFAIELGLTEIDVLVIDPDDHDKMRASSKMSFGRPWPASTFGGRSNASPRKTGRKTRSPPRSRFPLRQIRKLRLLATVHPAILDQIGAGDMPNERELRTIASAPREDQAAAWKKLKPKKGEGAGLVAGRPGSRKDPLLRQGRQVWRGRTGRIRDRLAGGPVRRGRRGQSLHCRRRSFRVRAARLARCEHAEERRLA